ncbi:MAG: 16S rRNA (adenine(1518)-N(6)/adenine(1519)-N(6))-dimethyltransferase RsmA [Vicingaceae bacterium]
MVRPKKHLGQHFLTDQNTAGRIADTLNIREKPQRVLEIGPGKGILTNCLLKNPDIELKVIEIDGESVTYLKEELQLPKAMIIEGDFLKTDLREIFNGQTYSVIGNFPYNISSQILFSCLNNRSIVKDVSGMFQREMARRICSPPGSKEYGILSVLLQALYQVNYEFTVNEGAFYPPPRVKSGVISLVRKEASPDIPDFKRFTNLVKTAFNQRRKQLRNTLKTLKNDLPDHPYLSRRPEELSWGEFLELYHLIHSG